VEPEWQKMGLLVIDEMQDVLNTDVLDYTRPISIPVEDPEDIEEQFDGISYSKGAAIIGMINNFLTPQTFQNGLRKYLTRWKYNNTVPADLWESFTAQAHQDGTLSRSVTVSDIMSTWTLQRGFPLIQVTRNYDTQTALFTQASISHAPIAE
jgi:aminopeptidase N